MKAPRLCSAFAFRRTGKRSELNAILIITAVLLKYQKCAQIPSPAALPGRHPPSAPKLSQQHVRCVCVCSSCFLKVNFTILRHS